MCDLKSFSFSHHFGSGFKYFSAVIICKLSKILNLRLSGGAHIQIYIHIQGFQKRGYEKGFVGRFPKVLFICVYLYISLLNWFHDSSPERGGGWSPSSISLNLHSPAVTGAPHQHLSIKKKKKKNLVERKLCEEHFAIQIW